MLERFDEVNIKIFCLSLIRGETCLTVLIVYYKLQEERALQRLTLNGIVIGSNLHNEPQRPWKI